MNLAFQCVWTFENVGKSSTHQQKTPRYFPSGFFLPASPDGGLDSSARGNRRCRPESDHGDPVDPLKRNDPPVPRKQHLKCLKLNIRCPIHGLSGEIALLTFCGILTFCSKASCSLQHMAHVIRFTCILSAKRFSKNFQPQHVNEFPFGKRNFHCYVYQSVIDGLDSWDPQKWLELLLRGTQLSILRNPLSP